MDVKEQIKRSVSITDVVSLYVNLKPAGKYLKGLCPFHTEKTPSFFVMPDKDTFTCYGCNKFGDIFSFVQEIENLTFPEAKNFLIDKFSIPVQRDKNRGGIKKDVYARINERANRYFRESLLDSPEGKKALAYLEKRGISSKTADLFSLGYAQNRWDGLYGYLRKQSADIEKAIELGLLIKNQNHRIYDRFRGRIIFPIYSESDSKIPIAFGGRTIVDEPSKYLNSPDTPLYKKSKHLYGFQLAKEAIRESRAAILVEGYFDVVSLYQGGVTNAVASLGTALTESQVYLLKRFSETVYFCYDGDKAGIDATLRGIEKMFEQNINPFIISLSGTDAKDPDEVITRKGMKAFRQLQEDASDGFNFLIRHMTQAYDTTIPERKNDAIRAIMGSVGKFGEPIIRNEYTRMVADFLEVDEKEIRKIAGGGRSNTESSPQLLEITLAERIFLENILVFPDIIGEVNVLLTNERLSVLASKNIIHSLLDHYRHESGEYHDLHKISEKLSEAEKVVFRDVFERSKSVARDRDQAEKEMESCILEFQKLLNKRREERQLKQEIKLAVKAANTEKLFGLLEKKTNYNKKRYKVIVNSSKEGALD
jgi:DNA primase